MEPTTTDTRVTEHEELVDMRTHLTVAMLAAAQLRRATGAVPDAARLDGYLQQALDNLRDDVRNVETLIINTEAEPEPGLMRGAAEVRPEQTQTRSRRPLPLRLVGAVARCAAGCATQWMQRRRVARLHLMTARY